MSEPRADAVELVPLDPRVRWLWGLSGALIVVQVSVPLLIVAAFGILPGPRWLLPAAWLVVGLLAVVALAEIRYRRWRYAVRDRDLWIRQGVLWVTVSVIPYARLQFVDTRQGPLDRLFGLAQLVVHTAALGTSGRLPGLEAGVAEQLRERLSVLEPTPSATAAEPAGTRMHAGRRDVPAAEPTGGGEDRRRAGDGSPRP